MRRKPVVYVEGASSMITWATLTKSGLLVGFADDRDGLVPYSTLHLRGFPTQVRIPDPSVVEIQVWDTRDRRVVRVSRDVARQHVSAGYRAEAMAATKEVHGAMGLRLGVVRSLMGITQKQLAMRSGVSRITIARIESGARLPRYRTLRSLADALGVPVERLIAPLNPRG